MIDLSKQKYIIPYSYIYLWDIFCTISFDSFSFAFIIFSIFFSISNSFPFSPTNSLNFLFILITIISF